MFSLFPPEWREWRFNPWSRHIGETYSVFVWAQWRVVVQGPERTRKVIEESELSEGWPYGSVPSTLLGNSCLALLEEEEAGCLRRMISGPLSQSSVVKQAPQFAKIAQKCIDEIVAGYFNKGEKQNNSNPSKDGGGESSKEEDGVQTSDSSDDSSETKIDSSGTNKNNTTTRAAKSIDRREILRKRSPANSFATADMTSSGRARIQPDGSIVILPPSKDGGGESSNEEDGEQTSDSQSIDTGEKMHKIKLEALRSYTFDLIDGPVLNLNRYSRNSSNSRLNDVSGDALNDTARTVRFEVEKSEDEEPGPEMFLLWMHRLKDGLCDIKITLGPQFTQLWRLNWYGRALNARSHLEKILTAHVSEREKLVPVLHEKGRATRDPFTSALPLVCNNLIFSWTLWSSFQR
jgi:hypothetical protein